MITKSELGVLMTGSLPPPLMLVKLLHGRNIPYSKLHSAVQGHSGVQGLEGYAQFFFQRGAQSLLHKNSSFHAIILLSTSLRNMIKDEKCPPGKGIFFTFWR